ncbi:MAG: hypothetical protein Q7J10_05580 [Methanosarcinaceae archaeon]|nr:hypothetical protein [Methanosarcinaceae archaeon]
MLIFSERFHDESIAEYVADNLSKELIEGQGLDEFVKLFIESNDPDYVIFVHLIEKRPALFLMAFFIAINSTVSHPNLNREVMSICRKTLIYYAKEHVLEMGDDLAIQVQKDHNSKNEMIMEIKDGYILVPLGCAINNMAPYTISIEDFTVKLKNDYVIDKTESWVTGSIFNLKRLAKIMNDEHPELISRSEEFQRFVDKNARQLDIDRYNRIPYANRQNSMTLSVITNALWNAEQIGNPLTIMKINKYVLAYDPVKPWESKQIQKIKQNPGILESALDHRVAVRRVKKTKAGRWTKYTVYGTQNKIVLDSIDDFGRLSEFPCFEKALAVCAIPHNIMVAIFSVLLWFYSIEDCHSIIKTIFHLGNYDHGRSENQLRSLLGNDGTPQYIYGTNGMGEYCIGYENCKRCWVGALQFPDRYYKRKDELKIK